MKMLVIGATRGIGGALVNAALVQAHDVTVLVRDPDRLGDESARTRLRVVVGNALDRAAVAEAVAGQDVILDCLGTRTLAKRITMFSRSAENLAATMAPEQLLIAVTGIGAGDSAGHGGFLYDRLFLPIVLRRMYDDKDRQEAIIRERIARWMIVRPGRLTNGPLTRNYRVLTDLSGIHGGSISRLDVADFLLSQAVSPRYEGRTPLLVS